ncbi:PqiC family protein [Granulosicoccus sp. 3-233]|uniref:PqiC family protein n=1 Tax=Granulosicoccus sp. 3-233 TaxID=3417969 RepID=UPI003D33E3E6
MKKPLSRRRRLSPSLACLLAGCWLLSACGGGPPPRLYLLEPLQGEESLEEGSGGPSLEALGMITVSLPGYASTSQISSINADGTVSQDSNHRWAEEPASAISRLLADRLRERADATVLIEPWPRDYRPKARVEVEFDRLLREPRGGADMAGQILLLSGDGRTVLRSVPFEFVLYGRDTAQRVFFVAVAKGIDDIAALAVEALREMRLQS